MGKEDNPSLSPEATSLPLFFEKYPKYLKTQEVSVFSGLGEELYPLLKSVANYVADAVDAVSYLLIEDLETQSVVMVKSEAGSEEKKHEPLKVKNRKKAKEVVIADPLIEEYKDDLYYVFNCLKKGIDDLYKIRYEVLRDDLDLHQVETFDEELRKFYELFYVFEMKFNDLIRGCVSSDGLEELESITNSFRKVTRYYFKVLDSYWDYIASVSRGEIAIKDLERKIYLEKEKKNVFESFKQKRKTKLSSLKDKLKDIQCKINQISIEIKKITNLHQEKISEIGEIVSELELDQIILNLEKECYANYLLCIGQYLGGVHYDGLEVFRIGLLFRFHDRCSINHSLLYEISYSVFFVKTLLCIWLFGVGEKRQEDVNIYKDPEKLERFWRYIDKRKGAWWCSFELKKGLNIRNRRLEIMSIMRELNSIPKMDGNFDFSKVQTLSYIITKFEEIGNKKGIFTDSIQNLEKFLRCLETSGNSIKKLREDILELHGNINSLNLQLKQLKIENNILLNKRSRSKTRLNLIKGHLSEVLEKLSELEEKLQLHEEAHIQCKGNGFTFFIERPKEVAELSQRVSELPLCSVEQRPS